MAPLVRTPDAEKVVIDYLTAVLDAPVHHAIPNPRPDRFVVVRRAGGPMLNLVADNGMLTIEGYGNGRTDARDIHDEARSYVRAMRGTTVGGVPIYRVNEVGGAVFLPDPASTQARFTSTVHVAMRGVAS